MFKSPSIIIRITLLILKSTVYTAVSAIRQPKSYIESLNALDITTLINKQLIIWLNTIPFIRNTDVP
jgi:hypothetical protein